MKEKDKKVILKGLGASFGIAKGRVKNIKAFNELEEVKEGEVLVAETTNPSFVPTMLKCSAVITDKGGITCHAAIVSREMSIPCVVGTKEATKVLNNGMRVIVDGEKGEIAYVPE